MSTKYIFRMDQVNDFSRQIGVFEVAIPNKAEADARAMAGLIAERLSREGSTIKSYFLRAEPDATK